jgi:amino acid permease
MKLTVINLYNYTHKYKSMSQLNPSWRTICALVNSMIGGTMLTLPILFRDAGIVIGVIVLMISGWISYKTC